MMATYLRRAKIAPDLVICSTAMRQLADSSLFGRWWSSAFRLTTPIFVARGPALLFGISRWDQQEETEQSDSRTDRGRAIDRRVQSELVSSIVPRGTSLRWIVVLSLRQFGVRRSDCRRHFPCPAELGSRSFDRRHRGRLRPPVRDRSWRRRAAPIDWLANIVQPRSFDDLAKRGFGDPPGSTTEAAQAAPIHRLTPGFFPFLNVQRDWYV